MRGSIVLQTAHCNGVRVLMYVILLYSGGIVTVLEAVTLPHIVNTEFVEMIPDEVDLLITLCVEI